MATPNYYETLQIPITATQDEIRDAYRSLARKYHPDLNLDKDTTSIMQELNDAYETLSDLSKRKEYDRTLSEVKNDQAYSSYTKIKEESEDDLGDWLKEYLRKKRKLDKIFNLYVEAATKNARIIKGNMIPTHQELEKEQFLHKELIKALRDLVGLSNNNPNQIQILNELFAELKKPTEAIANSERMSMISDPKNKIKQNIILAEIVAVLNAFTDKNNPHYTEIMAYILSRFCQVSGKIDDDRKQHFKPRAIDILIHNILSDVINKNYSYYEKLIESASSRK